MSIERAKKLGARNYDGIGDPEKARRGYRVMIGCSMLWDALMSRW